MGIDVGKFFQVDGTKSSELRTDIKGARGRMRDEPECEFFGCPSFAISRDDGRITCDYHEGLR